MCHQRHRSTGPLDRLPARPGGAIRQPNSATPGLASCESRGLPAERPPAARDDHDARYLAPPRRSTELDREPPSRVGSRGRTRRTLAVNRNGPRLVTSRAVRQLSRQGWTIPVSPDGPSRTPIRRTCHPERWHSATRLPSRPVRFAEHAVRSHPPLVARDREDTGGSFPRGDGGGSVDDGSPGVSGNGERSTAP